MPRTVSIDKKVLYATTPCRHGPRCSSLDMFSDKKNFKSRNQKKRNFEKKRARGGAKQKIKVVRPYYTTTL